MTLADAERVRLDNTSARPRSETHMRRSEPCRNGKVEGTRVGDEDACVLGHIAAEGLRVHPPCTPRTPHTTHVAAVSAERRCSAERRGAVADRGAAPDRWRG